MLYAITADVVLAAERSIEGGAVLVRHGTIARVGRARDILTPKVPRVALGRVVVTPGLINAHTHLSLTHLADAYPARPEFAAWIRVMAPAVRSSTPPILARAHRAGTRAAIASGTTAVGDIVSPSNLAVARSSPLAGVRFVEAIGMTGELGGLALPRLRAGEGLAPHAPYSTSPAIYRAAAALGRERGLRLALHVAESPDEDRFTRDGGGPLRVLLDELRLLPAGWLPPRTSPVAYLDSLGAFSPRSLAIHASFADAADRRLLVGAGAAVVTCPRSNLALSGRTADVPALLRAGGRVALGTDSLASSPSLSMLDEMRALRAAHPSLSAEATLAIATAGGASALGLDAGRIAVGARADLAGFRLPRGDRSPAEVVLEAERAAFVAVAGVVLRGRRPR